MIFTPTSDSFHLALLILPGSSMMSVASTIDPLRAANRFSNKALFSWTIYSIDGQPITLSSGIELQAEILPANLSGQTLAILAGFHHERYVSRTLTKQLRLLTPQLEGLGGIEAGTWLLAHAGLLDGHNVTTHWEDIEDMAEKFHKVNVVRDRFVVSGKIFTTGGASPCIDMMLHLIRTRYGRELAERVSSAFIYDPIHAGSDPQSLVSIARLEKRAPKVAKAIGIMEACLEEPVLIPEIAKQVGLSERRLEMLFREVLGDSPAAYFRQLRLAEAHRMIIDSKRPLQEIAVRCGFNSQTAFSRAFSLQYGEAPSVVRKRQSLD